MTKKLIAFGWYGGKFSHLDWLLPLLPNTHQYCEPFAGSSAVLLNRDQSPVETYNDLDGEVCLFFKVLRDNPQELIEKISLTPFSRRDFEEACVVDDTLPDLERARRFFVRARQVRTGLAQKASVGRWANCTKTSRSGMSGSVSRWLGGVEHLEAIASRLKTVQIENRPALDIIKTYDDENTLFYCDPPYLHETRGDTNVFGTEMSDDDHRKLAQVLNKVKGFVAVSGYDAPIMAEMYPDGQWTKIVGPTKIVHSVKKPRTECLWVNYDLENRALAS